MSSQKSSVFRQKNRFSETSTEFATITVNPRAVQLFPFAQRAEHARSFVREPDPNRLIEKAWSLLYRAGLR